MSESILSGEDARIQECFGEVYEDMRCLAGCLKLYLDEDVLGHEIVQDVFSEVFREESCSFPDDYASFPDIAETMLELADRVTYIQYQLAECLFDKFSDLDPTYIVYGEPLDLVREELFVYEDGHNDIMEHAKQVCSRVEKIYWFYSVTIPCILGENFDDDKSGYASRLRENVGSLYEYSKSIKETCDSFEELNSKAYGMIKRVKKYLPLSLDVRSQRYN